MRPVRLRLRGLRSYREAREVDLAGLGLFAVVGDTGAGKSSLIEAMVYALYGTSTWSGSDVRSLMADGAEAMEVELEFLADGRRYRVARSIRAGRGQAVHQLECLSDPDGGRRDGQAAVNAEVERLVGLDRDAFLSVVVLPQGRFDELLTARASERTAILKGIFRLERLGEIRERAGRMRDDLRARLAPLRAERDLLPAEPPAHLTRCTAEAERATAAERRLTARVQAHARHGEAARAAALSATAVRQAAARLEAVGSGDAGALLERALTAEARIAQEEAEGRALRARLDAREGALAGRRAALAGRGLPEGALPLVRAAVERLVREGPALAAEQRATAAARAALEADEETTRGRERTAAQLEAGLPAAAEAAREATAAAEGAAERRRAAAAALDALAVARAALTRADEEVASRRRACAAALEAGAAAADDLAGATCIAAEATARARAAGEMAAAARAARDHGAGDPCPVCARDLPPGFVPPQDPDLEAATAAAARAEAERTRCISAHAGAQARRAAADAELEPALVRQAVCAEEVRRTQAAAAALVPAGDVADAGEAALAPLAAAERAAAERAVVARRAEAEAGRAASAARSAAQAEARALALRRAQLDARGATLAATARELSALREAIPEVVRPSAGADPARDEEVERILAAAEAEVRALAAEAEALGAERARAAEAEAARERRRGREVEGPRGQARAELARRAEAAGELARLVGAEAPPAVPVAPGEELAALGALDRRAATLLARARAEAMRLDDEALAARAAAAATLAEEGAADAPALARMRDDAVGAREVARRDLARARIDVPRAIALDRAIVPAADTEAALTALHRALADGGFVGHVVARRQRALLEVASEILGAMTGARFGFAEDFRIVDRPAGRERSVKTLSGGETFLASLALALGLVELAGRAGGRLDALFLDEGFGALDPEALEEALEELDRRAGAGRLVGVISHVGAVAERIEDVLLVTRASPEGSDVRLLSGEERDLMLERSAGAGMAAR